MRGRPFAALALAALVAAGCTPAARPQPIATAGVEPTGTVLASFRSLHHVEWHLISAATLLTMAPIVVLFFFAQKAFVRGVTLTGVKG